MSFDTGEKDLTKGFFGYRNEWEAREVIVPAATDAPFAHPSPFIGRTSAHESEEARRRAKLSTRLARLGESHSRTEAPPQER